MTHQALPEIGARIRLIEMPNDPCPIEPGTLGKVTLINEITRQIGVKWDAERSLILVIGIDKFEVVTPHRVILIEDNAYTRYEVFVEATDPEQAAGIGREMVVDGKADGSGQHFRDDALPYVTDVINAAGEECAYSEEHDFEGVIVQGRVRGEPRQADGPHPLYGVADGHERRRPTRRACPEAAAQSPVGALPPGHAQVATRCARSG
jgi:hypothetical protein